MKMKNKSITLTHIMVRSFYFVMAAVVLISIFWNNAFGQIRQLPAFFLTLYVSLPLGLVALVCLDKLLCNIKKNIVFDDKNVRILTILSWCCFIASAIAMLSFVLVIIKQFDDDFWFLIILYVIFPIMSIGEAFVGLVVRVVKNSFEKAIEIKNENDLTI